MKKRWNCRWRGIAVGIIVLLAACLMSGCNIRIKQPEVSPEPEETKLETALPTETVMPAESAEPKCVIIDPGHQRNGNPAPEPIGPGAAETKARVTGGTAGRFTGLPEYELNLQISLKLKAELESRGYRVVMTRETNDVDLSNQERAQFAADHDGDIFVRIHANGSDDPAAEGAMTICMTADSPYHPELYAESRALSEAILDCMVKSAGCVREKLWETDTMSGVNWSTIPVTIVEVGYMTNRAEDEKLSTDAYQQLIVQGIADGIDRYFQTLPLESSPDEKA